MKHIMMALVALVLLSSCLDERESVITQIDDVIIEGVSDQDLYSLIAFRDTLRIEPKVTTLMKGDDLSHLSFEWSLIPRSLSDTVSGASYVVGTEKDLVVVPGYDGLDGYYGLYKVTNNETGLTYVRDFWIKTQTITSEGWAILCDEGGKTRLDWIYCKTDDEDEIFTDIWSAMPEYSANIGSPISLGFYSDSFGSSDGTGSGFPLINGSNGTYRLKSITRSASEEYNLKYVFGTNPDRVDIRGGSPQIMCRKPRYNLLFDVNGDIYPRPQGNNSVPFEYPINNVYEGDEIVRFTAAPFVALPSFKTNFWPQDNCSIIVYDEDGSRFLEYVGNASVAAPVKWNNDGIFGSTDNCEMLYMGATTGTKSIAILKNKSTNKVYLYDFTISNKGVNTQNQYMEIIGPNIDKATIFAAPPLENCIFYAYDDTIYRVNIYNDASLWSSATVEAIKLDGEEIVAVDIFRDAAWYGYADWALERRNMLHVGSNVKSKSENPGNFRIFNINQAHNPIPLVIKKELVDKGFGKIVDIEYFETK